MSIRRLELALRLIGGVLAGIGGWDLGRDFILPSIGPVLSESDLSYLVEGALAVICLGVAVVATPYVTTRPFFWLLQKTRTTPPSDLLVAAVGLVIGLLIGVLLALPLSLLPFYLGNFLPIVASLVLGYFGMTTLVTHKNEMLRLVGFPRNSVSGLDPAPSPKALLDTSAIIDGRIADVAQTGFLSGELVVPRFVLHELQRIADSPDALRRNRGRRGLEVLNRLQKEGHVAVEIMDLDTETPGEVDANLVRLARTMQSSIVTNDYNLNRVAGIQGVRVLNINELANAVKTAVLPGEVVAVHIIQEGKEPGQGVGYLEDGTMVVVENGRRLLQSTIEVVVQRVHQTVAGRMVFAHARDTESGPMP